METISSYSKFLNQKELERMMDNIPDIPGKQSKTSIPTTETLLL